jgi:hypothetical protein
MNLQREVRSFQAADSCLRIVGTDGQLRSPSTMDSIPDVQAHPVKVLNPAYWDRISKRQKASHPENL